MKDFTDREIKLGDTVLFYSVGFKSMYRGRVYNIGEKMVCVEYNPYNSDPLNVDKYKVYPKQCVVLESEDPVTLTKISRIL
jgi:hypothetical protein